MSKGRWRVPPYSLCRLHFPWTEMGRGTIVTKATHSAKDRTTYFIFTTWTRMSFLTYILWLKQGKISSTILICDRQSQRLKVNLLCSKTILYLEERKQEKRSKKGMQWEKLGKACPRNELKLACSFLERCWVHIETCDTVPFNVNPPSLFSCFSSWSFPDAWRI